MRIIAGKARGRTIYAPKGRHTRPTQDFVRESLFNIIQRDVPDAMVLDLFAGSGALALEALSRGAAHAVLGDRSRQAIECIRRNTETLGFSEQTTVLQGDWCVVVQRLPARNQRFDLVFLDPPYDLARYREMTDLLKACHLLQDDALLVIEHHKDSVPDLDSCFQEKDVRTYGDTIIRLFTFKMGGYNDAK